MNSRFQLNCIHSIAVGLALATSACVVADDAPDVDSDEAEILGIGNACGNQWTTPQIIGNQFTYPLALNADGAAPTGWYPSVGRFSRGGLLYLAGTQLNLRLVSDGCTYIKSVSLGAMALPKINTTGYWYADYPSTMPGGPGQVATDLFIHMLSKIEGATDNLTVTVGRTGGSGFATYSIPLVRVSSIEAKDVDAAFSVSESQVHNMFATALYDAFDYGGANQISVSGATIYGYNPSALSVSIGTPGVFFHFEFKASLPVCDPVVMVDGHFRINADENGLSLVWASGLMVTPHWPNDACVVATAPLDDLVWELSQQLGNVIEDKIKGAVDDALTTGADVNQFFHGTSTSTDVLNINLKLAVPSIAIRPTYDPAFTAKVQFPAGEKIGLIASGLGVREYATSPNNHWIIAGPDGLPKTGTPGAFWPATHALARPSGTVWNGQPIGRLLVRTWPNNFDAMTSAYAPGCAIKVPALSPYIRFGVNDTVGGVFQADRHYVRALFLSLNGIYAANATTCANDWPEIVVGP